MAEASNISGAIYIKFVMDLSGFYGAVHRHCMTAAKPLTCIQTSYVAPMVFVTIMRMDKGERLIQRVTNYSCDDILFSSSNSPSY